MPGLADQLFTIDIETCEYCGGAVKVIASIEDPAVVKKILEHLDRRAEPTTPAFRPVARAPPQEALPGLREPGGRRTPRYARTRGWPDTRHGVARACWSEKPMFPPNDPLDPRR